MHSNRHRRRRLVNNLKKSIGDPSTHGRKKSSPEEETTVDRLSDLPLFLQLRILSSLNARHAVQTMVLSKLWVSLWASIPNLNFCSQGFTSLTIFENFVVNVLSHRQPVKLDKLTFIHGGRCNFKIIEKVCNYAILHGVEELELNVVNTIKEERWPNVSSDVLTSLKLESDSILDCLFLQPRSGSFKNLTNLHLRRAIITDLDPFSVFPVLKTLNLVCCFLRTDGNALNVHCLQLLNFNILYYTQHVTRCEFTTPKLRNLEWRGSNFPQLKAHLPDLDTVLIECNGYCFKKKEKSMFDEMMKLFNTLAKAKSLRVSSSIVHLLTSFPYELSKCCSPFRYLRHVKLDFTSFSNQKKFECPCRSLMELLELVPVVKDYLLRGSNDAECTIMT